MPCCFRIMPLRVLQAEGNYYQSPSPLSGYFQRGWSWSPVLTEREWSEDNPASGSVSHDFDTAFTGMENPILVDFPDELKVECVQALEDGENVSYLFRWEWPDSPDCGGDGPVNNLSCSMGFRVIACGPVTLKAYAVGNVERLRNFNDSSPIYYSVYDHLSVWATRIGPGVSFDAGGCTQASGDKILVYSTGMNDDDGTCTMRRRVSCRAIQLCEGETALQVYCANGDGFHHEGGYYELTLTFACGIAGADCDAEETDPDYFPPERDDDDPTPPDPPCGENSEYPGEDEDCQPPQPPEVPPDTPCVCDDCAVYELQCEISGLLDTGCFYAPIGNNWASLASNLNGTYHLIPVDTGSEIVYEQELGTLGDITDPGILIESNLFVFDTGTDADNLQYDVYAYKIRHLGLACNETGIVAKSGASVQFDYQCFEHDPLTPALGNWVTGSLSCDTCHRIESFTTLLSNAGGPGCAGYCVYSNDYNDKWVEPGGATVCFCETDAETHAEMRLSPGGVSGGCVDSP